MATRHTRNSRSNSSLDFLITCCRTRLDSATLASRFVNSLSQKSKEYCQRPACFVGRAVIDNFCCNSALFLASKLIRLIITCLKFYEHRRVKKDTPRKFGLLFHQTWHPTHCSDFLERQITHCRPRLNSPHNTRKYSSSYFEHH